MTFTDTGADSGHEHRATTCASPTRPATPTTAAGPTSRSPTATSSRRYGNAVLDDGATKYWPLNEPAGTPRWSTGPGTTTPPRAPASPGARPGRCRTALTPPRPSTAPPTTWWPARSRSPGPNVFSQEVWFKTTSTAGGKIAGFGSSNTGDSSTYDRHIYMDTSGRVCFGVYPGSVADRAVRHRPQRRSVAPGRGDAGRQRHGALHRRQGRLAHRRHQRPGLHRLLAHRWRQHLVGRQVLQRLHRRLLRLPDGADARAGQQPLGGQWPDLSALPLRPPTRSARPCSTASPTCTGAWTRPPADRRPPTRPRAPTPAPTPAT